VINRKDSFRSCEEYQLQTRQYTKTDALFALLLYVVVLFLYYIFGRIVISDKVTLTNELIYILTAVFALITLVSVLLICLFRKQKITSVGFSNTYRKQSLKLGLILIIGITAIFFVITSVMGVTLISDPYKIIMRFFYYLFGIAFVEELVFRGYIGTRLYGCFKNKFIAISMTGLLFTFMHLPFQMLMADMTMIAYITSNWANLIFIFLLHYVFQALYAKYNSIVAPTLFHFIWDYVQWFIS
jgi:membrane protease YdiL (CAAX protease family)